MSSQEGHKWRITELRNGIQLLAKSWNIPVNPTFFYVEVKHATGKQLQCVGHLSLFPLVY